MNKHEKTMFQQLYKDYLELAHMSTSQPCRFCKWNNTDRCAYEVKTTQQCNMVQKSAFMYKNAEAIETMLDMEDPDQKSKYTVFGNTQIVLSVTVDAKNEKEAMKIAKQHFKGIHEYPGNGGTDKLIGVEGPTETIMATEEIVWDDCMKT